MALQEWVNLERTRVSQTIVWLNPENETYQGTNLPRTSRDWGEDLLLYLPEADKKELFVKRELVSENNVQYLRLKLTGDWESQFVKMVEKLRFVEKVPKRVLISNNPFTVTLDVWRSGGFVELIKSTRYPGNIVFKINMFATTNNARPIDTYIAGYWCWPE